LARRNLSIASACGLAAVGRRQLPLPGQHHPKPTTRRQWPAVRARSRVCIFQVLSNSNLFARTRTPICASALNLKHMWWYRHTAATASSGSAHEARAPCRPNILWTSGCQSGTAGRTVGHPAKQLIRALPTWLRSLLITYTRLVTYHDRCTNPTSSAAVQGCYHQQLRTTSNWYIEWWRVSKLLPG
jgi:hypothetical protein